MNEEQTEDMNNDEYENIAARIRHTLERYPRISPTMLQAGLGPQTKSEQWRPVLEDMILNGIVKQETHTDKSPAGRYNTYQVLSLVDQVSNQAAN